MEANGRVRLLGWKAIASHLGVTEKTAHSWQLERGFSVRRQGEGKKPPIVASVVTSVRMRRSRVFSPGG